LLFSRLKIPVNLHLHGFIVIGNIEGTIDLFAVLCNLLFSAGKRVSHKIIWLHRADWIIKMVLRNLEGIKWEVFRLVSEAVFKFAYTT
jgi:hypothetical protein